mmetsp:Transcript_7370/g.17967  ORF Transcript_7370/g.17967 Transcript_7370/m.17967 type:complete len:113 (-) Transcript_7370:30-368(-)|eukprot:CAMPEP_0114503186 /NCGR_PEP_ID=MMETSP0109-20121206/9508_1 /TAXON_ID=29199 /ORGANISM="Chlorarachnion reptans, Strain CCCM449" /LENGTH=112 /DNA_ID=CAMNT_0001681187 /DNA_START=157 /DNA_END=495 /DNA_ORIENTATION=-
MDRAKEVGVAFFGRYKEEYKSKKEIILMDILLLFSFCTGVLQFLYLLVAGQYPYNSFLAGFFSTLGVFISTACLRMQVANPSDFDNIPKERAFADFVVCNVILHFVVIMFMG